MECKLKSAGCGGCDMLQMSYSQQLAKKQASAQKLLGQFGKVLPIIGADDPFHYRCKLVSTFANAKDGSLISGLYAERSHRVLPTENCLLEDKRASEIVTAVRLCAALCRYEAFDEDRGTGLLRHVVVRRGASTGQVMVIIVTPYSMLPSSHEFVTKLRRMCPDITTIIQNINAKATSAVLGDKFKTLWGPGYIEDKLCGCSFVISPSSFYQVNPAQTEKLYRCAVKAARLTPKTTVLDAYCGTGTIGLVAAKSGAEAVAGVESNRTAVRDAIRNAKRNGLKNTRFFAADAGRFLVQLAQNKEIKTPDVIFMDPPRTGSDKNFLSALVKLSPRRIVYISCNPETLARDLFELRKGGYYPDMIQPVDMFPYTAHIECVVSLSKKIK